MDQDYRFEDFSEDADNLVKEILLNIGDDDYMRVQSINEVFRTLLDDTRELLDIDSGTTGSTCKSRKTTKGSERSTSLSSLQKRNRAEYVSCSVLEPLLSRVVSADSTVILKSYMSPAPAAVVETVFDSGRSIGNSLARLHRKRLFAKEKDKQ
jgi:hypothetical protein